MNASIHETLRSERQPVPHGDDIYYADPAPALSKVNSTSPKSMDGIPAVAISEFFDSRKAAQAAHEEGGDTIAPAGAQDEEDISQVNLDAPATKPVSIGASFEGEAEVKLPTEEIPLFVLNPAVISRQTSKEDVAWGALRIASGRRVRS